MAKVRTNSSNKPTKKIRPALTPEARENQLISLATDLVEQRLLDGTASSQETTHFLKLGSSKHKLELKKLEMECELGQAKKEAIESTKRMDEMYIKAVNAMRRYSGNSGGGDEGYDDYDDY